MSLPLKPCPSHAMLTRLGDRWTAMALISLDSVPDKSLRFSAIKARLDNVSHQMLTSTLRGLERDGLVQRQIYAEVPARTEYRLTTLGEALVPALRLILGSISSHWPAIAQARDRYDARHGT